MLRLENLTLHSAGRIILDALDLHVAPREIVALVGAEAAGKTAALECCLGRRRPDSGRVLVAGLDVARSPHEATLHLSSVPAHPDLPSARTGFAHLRESCVLRSRRIPEAILAATLVRDGIPTEFHHRRIADYSTALSWNLALTVAILGNATAVLLDDPTAGFAGAEIDALVVRLRRIRKGGTAILLATRDLAFARRLATRVVLLERGVVVETFDPNASRRAHADESYLAELIA